MTSFWKSEPQVPCIHPGCQANVRDDVASPGICRHRHFRDPLPDRQLPGTSLLLPSKELIKPRGSFGNACFGAWRKTFPVRCMLAGIEVEMDRLGMTGNLGRFHFWHVGNQYVKHALRVTWGMPATELPDVLCHCIDRPFVLLPLPEIHSMRRHRKQPDGLADLATRVTSRREGGGDER